MELQLFAMKGSHEFGQKISDHIEIPLTLLEEREFDDGEHKTRSLENVRNRNVFVVSSLYSEDTLSVNDKICRLLFFLSSLKDAGAREVTAIIPYFAYARKDKKTKNRDPLSFKYLAKLLETSGADKVMSMDIHNLAAYQNAFRIPSEHLEASSLFAPHLLRLIGADPLVVISPDAGGFKRATHLQDTLEKLLGEKIPLGFMDKTRSEGVIKTSEFIVGDVRNKTAIIYDDIISSGSTLALSVNALRNAGASKIIACITHGLFNYECVKKLKGIKLDHLLVTDTIQRIKLSDLDLPTKISVIDSSDLFARAIKRMDGGDSLSELQESYPDLYLSMSMQA
jgi:ribose-phosphate pyrophosphokinase